MSSRTHIRPLFVILFIGGCSAVPQRPNAAAQKEPPSFFEQGLARAGRSLNRSWQQVSGEKARPGTNSPDWDWALAIPSGAPRAELIDTALPNNALAYFVPEIQKNGIALVSATEQPSDSSWNNGKSAIVKVVDQPVKNWGQLYDAVETAVAAGEPVPVAFSDLQDKRQVTDPVAVSPAALAALTQTAAGDQPLIRVSDGGNSSLVIREGGIRCKLTARVERERGILHLVFSLGASWGDKQLLPTEIRADCSGRPLRCLSAADALELLYGDAGKVTGKPVNESARSFAQVSEREDYLIPSNYKRLEQENQQGMDTLRSRPQPALAAVPGVHYPGPAVLGDARALTSFLLQREYYEPGQPERVGWILFAGESLRDGCEVDVDLDLGSGMRRIRFMLPCR